MRSFIVVLGLVYAGCSDDTASGCRTDADCDTGYVCDQGRCRELCNSRSDCPDPARDVCLDGVCSANTFLNCIDVDTCPQGQECVESDGTENARCQGELCMGVGFSTCPAQPEFVCIDGHCQSNPYTTCEFVYCGAGEDCREDGTAPARCVPVDCTGTGQGTCPDPSYLCVDDLCLRARNVSAASFAGGVSHGTATSSGYRLRGMVSPPESKPVTGEVLTSESYRLTVGLSP